MIGRRVDRFLVLEKIGEGGRGVVYKAEDSKLNRSVALKFLPERLLEESDASRRLLYEARAAAALNHPHIVTIYEINEWENECYIAMEYIQGNPVHMQLAKMMKQLGVEQCHDSEKCLDQLIAWALQISDGLDKAHKAGIVHRDIKPENILVDKENHIKILDFGMAKTRFSGESSDKYSTTGTLLFLSPEHINREEVDHRTDIWSLGVVLYEMLAGKPPFVGETVQSIIWQIMFGNPEPISGLSGRKSQELKRIIDRMLQKDRESRYANIEIIVKELRSLQLSTVHIKEDSGIGDVDPYSLAVLPLEDRSPKKDLEVLCDGIADDLICRLGSIKGLRIAGRISSFQVKYLNIGIKQIGRLLKVATVLEGSVQKIGDRLRVNVNLVRTTDGGSIWARQYDFQLKDLFDIQDELTLAVTGGLKLHLLGGDQERLSQRHTENLEAFHCYLRGRYFWNRRYEIGLQKSLECFQNCLALDPGYPQPYVGIADSLNIIGLYGIRSPLEAYPQARDLTRKALELNPEMGEAYASLAWILTFFEWDWPVAEKLFLRALELSPGYATAHEWYAIYLGIMGRFSEALREIETARELDPLSLIIGSTKGVIHFFARQYDLAIDELGRVLEMDSHFPLALIWMGEAHVFKGDFNASIENFLKAFHLSGGMTYALANLGYAYGRSGQRGKALEVLEHMNQMAVDHYVSKIQKAHVYLGLEEYDTVFSLYEEALQERDSFFLWFREHPHFDPLRLDPRFQGILKKIGFS